ncbi:glycosyltransferase 87 family protein [Gordonia sp. MP11Mi]|uniref:Polyprenol-phosphate-mannose-dependent alpha-(1-2)-phosphatidylinositol mannoside mannosyltransferase n=1 Tax=Gordonia sp. MP11Mi TaxID=3022769 RepID=A0AA97CV68_9ACTN
MLSSLTLRDRSPAVLVGAAAALLAVTTAIGVTFHAWHGHVDLLVYRLGARALLDGDAVYGPLPALGNGEIHLPFTYPPLAAIAFAPFAALPENVATSIMFALSIAAIGLTVWLVLDRIRPSMDRGTRLAIVLAVVAVSEYTEPVRGTLGYGQVNALLMAAVAFDVLNRCERWPRGILIGIAVAIKLTPAGFLLLFLIRRDWRAFATTIASTIVSIGIAWLVMPDDSREYWFHKLSETGRIGAPYFAGNQSLKGLVYRLGLGETAATLLWLALSVVVVVLAAVWMHRLLAERRLATALVVNSAAILLISPISWSHHWVWFVPALVIAGNAIVDGRRDRWFVAATGTAFLMFFIGPHWLLPGSNDVELDWAWWQQIIGASYVIFTVAVLALGAWHSPRTWDALSRRP